MESMIIMNELWYRMESNGMNEWNNGIKSNEWNDYH